MEKCINLGNDGYHLCAKVFKKDIQSTYEGNMKEHEHYYNITDEKYSENFLIHIEHSSAPNISFPLAAYHSKFLFGNISKFNNCSDLYRLTGNKIILNEKMTAKIICDILKGLKSLHNAKNNKIYCHRDLKPNNVVLNLSNEENLEANIVDAGTIREKENHNNVNSPICAVTGYRDLEDLKNGYTSVDDKTDIFAVGIIMWELLFGRCPFAGPDFNGISTDKIIYGLEKLPESLKLLYKNEKVSDNCKDLLSKLLTYEKNDRISAEKALKHSYFK